MNIKNHIPNSITLLNLMSGSVAAILALKGDLPLAALFTGMAAVFDFFDGFVARLLRVTSNTGKELDSLADVISFGFTPSVILYCMISESNVFSGYPALGMALPYTALLIAAFSALRLAKFNLDTRQTSSFLGLPTPANAMFIVSLPLIAGDTGLQNAGIISGIAANGWFLLLLIPVSCYLLVSEIPLFALKFTDGFSYRANRVKYYFLLGSLALLVTMKWAGLPLSIILYILLSVATERKKV